MDCQTLGPLGITRRDPVCVYYDNISTMYMTPNPIQHDHRKYIVVDNHVIHKRVVIGDWLYNVHTTRLPIVDIFIRGLTFQQFLFLKFNQFI